MSQQDTLLTQEETADQVRRLHKEINERDEDISEWVDTLMEDKRSNPPEALKAFEEAVSGTEAEEMIQHLLRLKLDWDTMFTRICAYNEDDDEFLDWLLELVGDLLLEQYEGIDEKWMSNLQEFLDRQSAKVS